MTTALLSPSPLGDASGGGKKATGPRGDSILRTGPDDRWQSGGLPIERFSVAMALLLFGSIVLHGLVFGTAFLGETHVLPQQQEISVEVVQEPPKDPPKPPPAAKGPGQDGGSKPAELRKTEAPEPPKPEAKVEPPKPEPVKPEPPKVEPKIEPPKPEPPKPQPPKAEEPRKPEPPKAAEGPKPAPQPDPADKQIETMENELAALKAERDALETEKTQAKAALARQNSALGPLPDSFQAVALPSTAEGAEDAVGYQSLVFSQLAKAKGDGQRQGVPGSAGVRFEVDEKGQLVSAKVVVPSGDPTLDAEALAIVHKAAPFPVPPQGAQRSFSVNVSFTPVGTPAGR